MAIFRPGPLAGAISGNLGSVCFVAGKGAPVIRRRICKKNSRTPKQLAQRAVFQLLAEHWTNLPTSRRIQWATAAFLAGSVNRLGIKINPAPRTYYLHCAVPYYQIFGVAMDHPIKSIIWRPFPPLQLLASASGNIRVDFFGSGILAHYARIFASRHFTTWMPAHSPNLKYMVTETMDQPTDTWVDFTDEFHAAFGRPIQGETISATCAIFFPGTPVPYPRRITTTVFL